MNTEIISLIGVGFSLGVRHALDWDHIAATTDFLGADSSAKKGVRLSLYYVLGHASINLLLGLLAVFLGQSLPEWVDETMERVVGAVLIGLGLWLILVLIQNRNKPVVVSRGALLVTGAQNLYALIYSKLTGKPAVQKTIGSDIGPRSACSIGVIHGIGGETATQILLFTTAAGASSISIGFTVVLAFIAGLFISQALMALLLFQGYAKSVKNPRVYTGLSLATALYSIILGFLFIFGESDTIPSITSFFS
ncbi:hypothetical protein [Sporomusa sp.]|uniref:HoxN/HupN/NixA family nickel/cobalt transporter n=1 Tax=Sporomusa sp. TaxID=2078658 RepID=UPI002D0841B8|nr:hypothetical protein [Sporomusa sp.]HWR42809.1 hypothetical protein [Sporomusa sp.]